MTKDSFKVFLIIEGLNALVRKPITTFICKERETAKAYFENYIKDLKTSTYSLYEIMEITKNGMTEKRMFITTTLNIKVTQLTLNEERKRIKEALQHKEDKEKIIEKLFGARRINDKKEISETHKQLDIVSE